MPDPNAGWLDQPDPSSPTQTNRDALIAANPFPPNVSVTPTPDQERRVQRKRRVRAFLLAVLAVLFFAGAIADALSGNFSPIPPLVLGVICALVALVMTRRSTP